MIGKIEPGAYEPYAKNPKIAKVFEIIGLADELGSGVKNIYKYTKIYSNAGEPGIKENDIFTVKIHINKEVKEKTKSLREDKKIEIGSKGDTIEIKLNKTRILEKVKKYYPELKKIL